MSNEVDMHAKVLWDYHHVGHDLESADLIFALGSHDLRVATTAAKIYLEGHASTILFSGNTGVGKEQSGFNGKPEALAFKQEAMRLGVPNENILVETEATNTGENIKLSSALLKELNIPHAKIIVVQKPYMERRTLATLLAQWPEPLPKFIIASQKISYDDYMADGSYSKDFNINVMVGDLQRIIEYPKRGWQVEQDVPQEVIQSYEALVSLGYNQHLL